jgi:DNA-directed RNA polymerase subunit L
MKVNLIRKETDLLEIELPGEETLTHLIARFSPIDCAAVRDHPFLTEPRIVAYGKDPVKALIRASDDILAMLEEFKTHFSRAIKEKLK